MALAKRPGDQVGADITFKYRGPSKRLYYAFGVAPSRNIDEIYQIVGSSFVVPDCLDWTTFTQRAQAGLTLSAPLADNQDCYAHIAEVPNQPGNVLDGKWHDNVYDISGVYYLRYDPPCGGIRFPIAFCNCTWVQVRAHIDWGLGEAYVMLHEVEKVIRREVLGGYWWWEEKAFPSPVQTSSIIVGAGVVEVPITFSRIEVWYTCV